MKIFTNFLNFLGNDDILVQYPRIEAFRGFPKPPYKSSQSQILYHYKIFLFIA